MSDAIRAEDLRQILDTMTEMVCRFRIDGTVLYVNDAYCRFFGLDPNTLVGSSYEPVVHPDDRERVRAEVASMSRDNPTLLIENRVLLPSGETRWTQWTNRAFFGEGDVVLAYQSAGRDVSARVAAELELAENNSRFRFLAEASALLVSSLDHDTTLSRVARLAVPFLADSCTASVLDERGNFHRAALAHVDPELERLLSEPGRATGTFVMSPGLRRLGERVLRGEPVLVERLTDADLVAMDLDETTLRLARLQRAQSYMIVPMLARDRTVGAMTFVACAGHSNRFYTRRDLELAVEIGRRAGLAIDNARLYGELQEADRRKDRFLATLAHELRNPMAAILNSLETLQEPGADLGMRQRALEIAARQIRQQARLVEDLLDASRLTRNVVTLRRETVDAAALVREVAETHRPFAERRRQRLTVTAPGPVPVSADEARIRQIVGNLVDNAIKYTPDAGNVLVTLECDGGTARIAVRDDGVGISAEVRDRLFEPFVQGAGADGAPSAGLGIGLTIARELVALHDGSIEVHSPGEGHGAEFIVTLPMAEDVAEAATQAAPSPAPERLRVLVVDDNADAADMVSSLLQAWGQDAQAVYDGRAAIDLAPRLEPQLILVDIGMPGMDGFDTARELRRTEAGARARLVAVTGYAQPKDVQAAADAGFDRHVAKPVDAATLRQLIDEARQLRR